MTDPEILNTAVAVGSLVVAGLATLAAFRSAGSAAMANKALIDEQLQAGRREVAQLVAGCSAEYRRIQFLARTLRHLDTSLATFSGAFGGSVMLRTEKAVGKLLETAAESYKPASTYAGDPVALGRLIPEDVDRLAVALTLNLGELQSIADELERESMLIPETH